MIYHTITYAGNFETYVDDSDKCLYIQSLYENIEITAKKIIFY